MATNLRVHGAPGSLYARCGGAFGVASFIDHLMDKWMADPVLNTNKAVATWHDRLQRCGFKFLTAQYLCDRIGGPHRYTGRPLELAHKHLNIQSPEWDTFMDILTGACLHFGFDQATSGELHDMFSSVKGSCVVQEGERAPPNPGPIHIAGQSLYARLGGVYPIALFTDRLVDGLLADDRIHIPYDGMRRNEASLKFFFTEVVCNTTGGPEALTCKDHDDTKLLVPGSEWGIFLATAGAAADHFPEALRVEVVKALQHARYLIVDPATADDVEPASAIGAAPPAATPACVKDVQAAALGKKVSKEILAARLAAPGEHVAARRHLYGDPRTLYGRGGGAFGLARLSSRMMDVWMSNPALNANHMVSRWHNSNQKYGFKFLVTQIMGYLTGGPQRYTGRSMEMAHKHLAITGQQWDRFAADAEQVLEEFGMEHRTRREFAALFRGLRSSCVLAPGDCAPPDPGPSQPSAALAGSLYFRLGGVYPIARFVSDLIDAALADGELHLASQTATGFRGRREPSGLKYLVTELVCHGTGGEERVTSWGLDEAKLGVPTEEWPLFVRHADEAASIWRDGLRAELLLSMEGLKPEICVGTKTEGKALPREEAVCRLHVAGSDAVGLAKGPLSGCQGDSGKAATAETRDEAILPGSVPVRCPFASHNAKSGSGRPPRHGREQASQDRPVSLLSACKTAIQFEAYSPIKDTQEAGLRPPSQDTLEGLWHDSSEGNMVHGRTLGSSHQDKLDELLVEDPSLCCPISLMLFTEPARASDGFVYESASIKVLTRSNMVSPMSHEHLAEEYTVERDILSQALKFRSTRAKELMEFVTKAAVSEPNMAISGLERISEYVQVLKPDSEPELVQRAARHWEELKQPVPPELQGGSTRRRTLRPAPQPEGAGDPQLSRTGSTPRKAEADFRAHLDVLLSTENAARTLGLKLYERFGGRLERLQTVLQLLEQRWGFPQRLMPLLWTHLRRAVFTRRGVHLQPGVNDEAAADTGEVEEEEWVDAFTRWLQALAARCCQAQVSRETCVQKFDSSGGMYFQGPKLGVGAYGEVFLMFHKRLSEERVVKVIHRDQMTMSAEDVEAEVNILKSLDHPNVVRLYESFEHDDNLYIVMDYAEGGDLASFLQQVRDQEKSCTEIWSRAVAEQILAALAYIHSKGIIHCDLKPANTMLLRPVDLGRMETPHILLVDFGLSELFAERNRDGQVQVKGTPLYLSPEAFEGHLSDKSDMWALGIMIFELLLGRRPFQDSSVFVLWSRVARTEPPLDDLRPKAREVVKRLLNKDPLSRPTATECRALPWFSCNLEESRRTRASRTSVLLSGDRGNLTYFRRAAMLCMATELSMKDMDDVYQVFQDVDTDKTGNLSLAELTEALNQLGVKRDPAELMEVLDLDQNGSISYTEFLAGTLSCKDTIPEQRLRQAFDMFDLDGDGTISSNELRIMLSGNGPLVDMLPDGQTVSQILEEIGNGAGCITFDCFRSYLNGDAATKIEEHRSACGREIRAKGISKMLQDLERASSKSSSKSSSELSAADFKDNAGAAKGLVTAPQAPEVPPLHAWLQAALGDPEAGIQRLLRFPDQQLDSEAARAHLPSITRHLLAGICLVRMLADESAPKSLEQLQKALPAAIEAFKADAAPSTERPSRSSCWFTGGSDWFLACASRTHLSLQS